MSDAIDDQIASDLYDLTELMARHGHDAAHGFLGGEWGYGAEHDCPVFEMHPFWWGDCECGYEDREAQWEDENPHAEDCYQTELLKLEVGSVSLSDVARQLAREWGLPEWGCAVHCTCRRQQRWQVWSSENAHKKSCPIVRPNFRHKGSGIEGRWYKYLGRDMEISQRPSLRGWADIVDECRAAVTS